MGGKQRTRCVCAAAGLARCPLSDRSRTYPLPLPDREVLAVAIALLCLRSLVENRANLLDEARQRVGQAVLLQAVEDKAPALVRLDQPGSFQDLQMLGQGWLRHVETARNVAGRELSESRHEPTVGLR